MSILNLLPHFPFIVLVFHFLYVGNCNLQACTKIQKRSNVIMCIPFIFAVIIEIFLYYKYGFYNTDFQYSSGCLWLDFMLLIFLLEDKAYLEQRAKEYFEEHRKAFVNWRFGEIDKIWIDKDGFICIQYESGDWWHYKENGDWW